MIKLTRLDGYSVYINKFKIIVVEKEDNFSIIHLENNIKIIVKESVEDILQLI